jgi:hypothetical protein
MGLVSSPSYPGRILAAQGRSALYHHGEAVPGLVTGVMVPLRL